MGKISVSRSSTIYLKLLLGFWRVKEADGAGPELGGDPEGIANKQILFIMWQVLSS